jgi:hypothetical protein
MRREIAPADEVGVFIDPKSPRRRRGEGEEEEAVGNGKNQRQDEEKLALPGCLGWPLRPKRLLWW